MADNRIKTVLIVVMALVAMGGVYYLANSVIPKALVTLTKAAPATKVSIKDSQILGARILCKADGKDKCKINVFVLDEAGKGVQGKKVELEGMETIVAVNKVSDTEGKVAFEMVSEKPGQYEINGSIEGVPMTRGVKVTFR
jgi:hypothetical protein